MKKWAWLAFLLLVNSAWAAPDTTGSEFAGIVAHRGVPSAATDWSFAPFADQGAWFGFALPPDDKTESRGGFSGPFLMSNGRWLAKRLLSLDLHDAGSGLPLDLSQAEDHSFKSFPGILEERFRIGEMTIQQRLWFDRLAFSQSGLALVQVTLSNTGQGDRSIIAGWSGDVFKEGQSLGSNDNVLVLSGSDQYKLRVVFGLDTDITTDSHSFTARTQMPIHIGPGETVSASLAVDLTLDGDPEAPLKAISKLIENPEQSLAKNRQRWSQWLNAVDPGGKATPATRRIAIKALQTLVNNWRGPAGRMQHHGMFPSHNVWYFNGYWAWDTWKQAAGVATFDTRLAQDMVIGMFQHQDDKGMIADVVYLDAAEDNWRDTKPPLAGWAIDSIYQASGDLEFVRKLYPKLLAYHEFWYRDRDHNQNGLCEYGSTDGTLEAARWESGMDNAVRFDHSTMLQNNPTAWSMNQESVDLNSYLYLEKLALARLAKALGKDDSEWLKQAEDLKTKIQRIFYDKEDGWFYDVNIESGGFVRTQSPEGWIPLWTGAATQQQADSVRQSILNPEKFRTHIPLPTVAADNPEFSEGYWRGLVWLDQVYFGIEGLRRYGFADDADALTQQLFRNLEGVAEPGVPIFENYHPQTGAGRNVSHFSWSAAHLLMLTMKHAGQ